MGRLAAAQADPIPEEINEQGRRRVPTNTERPSWARLLRLWAELFVYNLGL